EGRGVDHHGGAADYAVALEFLDPLGDRGARQADALGDLRRGGAAVPRQQSEDLAVVVIQIEGHKPILQTFRSQEKPPAFETSDGCGLSLRNVLRPRMQ